MLESSNRGLFACAAGAVLVSALAGCQGVMSAPGGDVLALQDRPTTLRQGEHLAISLAANPSTGFAWVLKPYDEAVLAPSTPFNVIEPGAHRDGEVGVPGTAVWRFDARAPGATVLTYEYRRAWSDAAPAQTASFPITVR